MLTHLHGPVYASHRRPVVFLAIRMQNCAESNRRTVTRTRVRDNKSLLGLAARHHGKLFDYPCAIWSRTCELDRHFVNSSRFFSLSPHPRRGTVVPTCNARAISSSDPPSGQRIPSSRARGRRSLLDAAGGGSAGWGEVDRTAHASRGLRRLRVRPRTGKAIIKA